MLHAHHKLTAIICRHCSTLLGIGQQRGRLMLSVGLTLFRRLMISRARVTPLPRLFSSAHFNDTFPQHTPPEVLNTPLEGVVLALKALSVDRVARFPFPTPPDEAALTAAQRCLEALGALDRGDGGLTALGRAMARLPVGPRHARMILQVLLRPAAGCQETCYARCAEYP